MNKSTEILSKEERDPYDKRIDNFIKENNTKDHLIIFITNKTTEEDTNKIFLDFKSSSESFKFISEAFTKILLDKDENDVFLYEIFLNSMSKALIEKISDDYKREFLTKGDVYDKLEKTMDRILDDDFIKTVKF